MIRKDAWNDFNFFEFTKARIMAGEGNGTPLQYSVSIPQTEEPGWLQSVELQRVGHDWMTELNWIDRFWVVVFSFSFFSMHILISLLIYSVICWLFRSVLFSLHMFVFLTGFFFFSCSWHLILPNCDQKRCLKWFQFFWIYQG